MPPTTRPRAVFALVATAQFMVVLDTAIINVALPSMEHYLAVGDDTAQWLVTAYVLAFGSCLLLGGRAGDLFGRRRVLLAGTAAFTLLSLAIGVGTTLPELVILRALQGLSAAMMAPTALSVLLAVFPAAPGRGRALGFWSMIATGGAAVGLLLGGVLTHVAGWRWTFWINVPVGLVLLPLLARVLPRDRPTGDRARLDLPGAVTVTLALLAAVLGFSRAPVDGWSSARVVVSFVVAAGALASFVLVERRVARPLVDLSVFRYRKAVAADVVMAAVYAGNLGFFFVLTLWMQDVQRWPALQTGLAFLPFPVVLGAVSSRMGGLLHRYGYRRFLVLGPCVVAAGMLWLCFLPAAGTYAVSVLPGLLVMAVGYGLTFAPVYSCATGRLPPRLLGTASGLVTTAQQIGGAVGLAVLSGVAASVARARGGRGSAQALTAGYDTAMAVAAGFTLLAVLVAVAVVRTPSGERGATRAERDGAGALPVRRGTETVEQQGQHPR
ncbi:MFS transporter [Nakamurella endophytica]|uniref:MFS transporter n=1 Tax=Nakamurella endophytica TaxID=1748367 RepID=A0A917WEM0_9ACTN|nr:MFS transporter [Nakamurella endophytica]GGL98485.1 MFS transporter [Nakamurella endophytica]